MQFHQIVWLDFDFRNEHYEVEAIPAYLELSNASMPAFDIYFNNEYNGTLIKNDDDWIFNSYIDKDLARIIGNKLLCYT